MSAKQPLDTVSKHPLSLAALADRAWNGAVEVAFRTGWSPLTGLAESAVTSCDVLFFFQNSALTLSRLMRNITQGHLRVLTYSNIYAFPAGLTQSEIDQTPHKAELRVVKDSLWVRLCAMGDLGFAEAYMYGDVECDDLVSLFHVS